MPNKEVNHDGAHVGLELARLHPPHHLLPVHEHKLLDLAVVTRQRHQARRRRPPAARRRREVQVVDVQDLAVEQRVARVPVQERDDACGPEARRHDGARQPGLLVRLGEHALERRVVGLDAARDGAVQQARVCVERAAAAGDPDAGDGGGGWITHVGGEVRAARVDAKERGGEALDPELRPAGDEKGLAVQAAERGEAAAGQGRVDGLLQRGVGEGRRRGHVEGHGAVHVADGEARRPLQAHDRVGVDEAVRAGVGREEELEIWVVVGGKVERKAGTALDEAVNVRFGGRRGETHLSTLVMRSRSDGSETPDSGLFILGSSL